MELIINFSNLKPISVNASHYRSGAMKQGSRALRATILKHMQGEAIRASVRAFKGSFDPKRYALSLSLTFTTPEDIFYTKAGSISNRSQDLDNCVKLIQDSLFNPRYDQAWLIDRRPQERKLFGNLTDIENIGIDDRFITELKVSKKAGPSYSLSVHVHIIPN